MATRTSRAIAATNRSRSTNGLSRTRTAATKPRRAASNSRRRKAGRGNRLGPLFFTVAAVTGLCALAFMGLVASVMAGA